MISKIRPLPIGSGLEIWHSFINEKLTQHKGDLIFYNPEVFKKTPHITFAVQNTDI